MACLICQDFQEISQASDLGYVNGRSLASGLLNKHEPVPELSGRMNLVVYNVLLAQPKATHFESLNFCKVRASVC